MPIDEVLSNETIHEPRNISNYRTILPGNPVQRTTPTILLYTPFEYYKENIGNFSETCNHDCIITQDTSLYPVADAVIFHLADLATYLSFFFAKGIGVRYYFPTYRRPDQVWVLFNDEPVSKFYEHFDALQDVFNWTVSYRRNADVTVPYGSMTKLSADDQARAALARDVDYFDRNNMSGATAMITNCNDDARRYQIINSLKSYIGVKIVGKCGEPCPKGYHSCVDVIKHYKFYLAFENSDCIDYVTEKYWRALGMGQVPVVAWKQNMTSLVIPGSYINVYDFPSLDAACKYIQSVNNNRTLYNKYFLWKNLYKLDQINGFCNICEKLLDAHVPRMVYHDMRGWLVDDACKPATVSIDFGKYSTCIFISKYSLLPIYV